MYNYIHLQEQVLEEHHAAMQSEMAQKRLLARAFHSNGGPARHIVSILGSRLIAIGMRLERVEQVYQG